MREAAPLEGGEIDGLNPTGAGPSAPVLTFQPSGDGAWRLDRIVLPLGSGFGVLEHVIEVGLQDPPATA